MWTRIVAPAVGLVVGAALGLAVRAALRLALPGEPVLLAAIALAGWFAAGFMGGWWRHAGPWLRALLGALAALGFTSLPTLLAVGPNNTGEISLAVLELVFGLFCAGVGVLAALRLRPVRD